MITTPHQAQVRGDDGTVLLLIIGLATIAALLVAVVTDVSALYLERRELIAAVDGAALAGAQAVDEESIYRDGLPPSGPVPLDADAAEQAARDYLADAGVLSSKTDVTVTASTTTVTVALTSRFDLPVASTVTAGSSGTTPVFASATARTAVIP
jgi:uncharacterized membrane protein